MYSLIVFGSLLLFVVSEKTFIHFSRTARRAFWYVISCAIVLWIVKWLQEIEGIGMMWIFITAVLAASVVEDEYLKKTGLTPMDIEATQKVRLRYRTPEAQGHAERIMDIVNSITRGKGYTAGTKQLVSRVSGATKRLQRGLHKIIVTADPEELNYIMCAVNVAAMVEVASDKTMKLLVETKLPILETVSRAALVDGLQKLGLRHRRQRQEWVRDVILQTYGMNLTHFKAYIDDGGDYHSMYKLIYHDLQSDIRTDVFEHIRSQGHAVISALDSLEGDKPPSVALKILSDVDDTVFSSGSSFPAGVDSRYPRKCYYPGVLALYAAIDRHFAWKYASHLEQLRSISNQNSPLSEKEKDDGCGELHAMSNTLRNRAMPMNIPRLNVATPRSRPERFINYGAQSPFGGQSPDFSMLGDLLTPRDTFNFSNGSSSTAGSCASRAHQEGSNLVLLSARPESYKGLTESESYRKYFQPLVMRGDLSTSPTMLLGSLDSGPKALIKLFFGGSNVTDHPKSKTATAALYQTLAAKKLSRFREYAALYPEAGFVYVGDNGQGDVLCAETLTSSLDGSDIKDNRNILACFIHKVAPTMSTLSMYRKEDSSEEDLKKEWGRKGISLDRTHLGMAKKALEMGLIDKHDLRRIVSSAMTEFRRISCRYTGRHAGRHLSRAANDLNIDIMNINSDLPETERFTMFAVTDDTDEIRSGIVESSGLQSPELSSSGALIYRTID